MRDFGIDTPVSGGDGRYSATLAAGWDIWGPQADMSLQSPSARPMRQLHSCAPAAIACHFLRVRLDGYRARRRRPRCLTRPRGPDARHPFVDAVRMLVAADSAMYPAAVLAHEGGFPYIAPSLDLVLSFHRVDTRSEWLLVESFSPLSEGALVAGRASLWSSDGRLLASAMQQMLQRT